MVDQKTLDAFEQMWGPFPEPVLLLYKDRTILATNEMARAIGISTGVKCFSLNPEAKGDNCRQCRANLALREGRTICEESAPNGQHVIGYWMPLKTNSDVYVHLGIGQAKALGLVPAADIATCEGPLVTVPSS